jgi:hypothetical protein
MSTKAKQESLDQTHEQFLYGWEEDEGPKQSKLSLSQRPTQDGALETLFADSAWRISQHSVFVPFSRRLYSLHDRLIFRVTFEHVVQREYCVFPKIWTGRVGKCKKQPNCGGATYMGSSRQPRTDSSPFLYYHNAVHDPVRLYSHGTGFQEDVRDHALGKRIPCCQQRLMAVERLMAVQGRLTRLRLMAV